MVVVQYTQTELPKIAKAGFYFIAVVLVLADKKNNTGMRSVLFMFKGNISVLLSPSVP